MMRTIIEDLDSEEFMDELQKKDINKIKLPYTIKHHPIFSPGIHNNYYYSKKVIEDAYHNTNWNKHTLSIYLDHRDNLLVNPITGQKEKKAYGADVRDWVGMVKNLEYKDGTIYGDLDIVDLELARKIMYGAHFGVSPSGDGEHQNNKVTGLRINNWSVVVNPAIKTTYFNFAMHKAKEGEKMSEHEEIESSEGELDVAAQLKAMTEKYNALASEIEELKKKKEEYPEVKEAKEEKDKEKKKEEEEKKKDKYPEEERSENSDKDLEEFADMIHSMSAEELTSWKELVKKYGIKKAKEEYEKKKNERKLSEQNEKMASLEKEITELKESVKKSLLVPEIFSPNNLPTEEGGKGIMEMSDKEVNEGMVKYFEAVITGVPAAGV